MDGSNFSQLVDDYVRALKRDANDNGKLLTDGGRRRTHDEGGERVSSFE